MAPDSLLTNRTVMYTPEVHVTGRRPFTEVDHFAHLLSYDINTALFPTRHPSIEPEDEDIAFRTELIIIDEADRISNTGREELRDFFDRTDLSLILIGMHADHAEATTVITSTTAATSGSSNAS